MAISPAGTGHHDATGLQQVRVLGEFQRQTGVLLDQQDADAGVLANPAQDAENLLHDQRRQAERRLIQQQQARAQHQGAGNRQHLLLAAGQGAGLLFEAFLQPREVVENAFEIGRRLARRDGYRRRA